MDNKMKYVIYLLIGIGIVTAIAPLVDFEKVKSFETAPIASTEIKAEEVKEPVKDAKNTEEVLGTPTPEEPTIDIVKENPNGCKPSTEWIYPDGSCHAKAIGSSPSSSNSNSAPIVGSGSCEASIRRIFPTSQHSTAIRVMLQESSGNPANHNYNERTRDNSYGCFQVNLWGANARNRPPASELVKADVNVAFAYNLWKSTGWCSSGGWLNTSKKLGIC